MGRGYNFKEESFVYKNYSDGYIFGAIILLFVILYVFANDASKYMGIIAPLLAVEMFFVYKAGKILIIGSEELIISRKGITMTIYYNIDLETIEMSWKDIDMCFIDSERDGNNVKKEFKVRLKNGDIHGINVPNTASIEEYQTVVNGYAGGQKFDYEGSKKDFESCGVKVMPTWLVVLIFLISLFFMILMR